MERTNVNTDTEKRGKLLLLAALIAISMFINKILQENVQSEIWQIYMRAGIYFVLSFVGLLWSFSFLVKPKSFLYIIQAAFFVFSESIFIEFFFFQKFNRLYEALILLLLIGLVFMGNYVAFLMANVLNVGLFKKIPLIHVGRTSSYILSLLGMYFLTFSFLLSNFNIYIILPCIIVSYALIIYVHYLNVGLEGRELVWKSVLSTLVSLFLFIGSFLTGTSHELISFLPVLGYFFCVGVVSQESAYEEDKERYIFYFILLAVIFFISLFLNLLG
jgi:hypothetical protein